MPFEGIFFLQNRSGGYKWDYKNVKGLCTHFKNSNNEAIINNATAKDFMNNNEFAFRNDVVKDRIYFKNSNFETLDDWLNFFANNNVILEYEILEETTEKYAEEQQTVYNQLQKLLLYKHYNYIMCTDEIKCKMKLTYRPDRYISLEERVKALELATSGVNA